MDVLPQYKLLIWQDSYGIRCFRCDTEKPYAPETMKHAPDWLTTSFGAEFWDMPKDAG